MKQRIFMYLFVFTLLIVLFQYVNSKRVFEDMNGKIEACQHKINAYNDTISAKDNEILTLSHFNLERNEDALSYFEKDGYNVSELIPFIKDELYKLNEVKGEHPMVPYAAGEGKKILINTVKMLNHKWIIADFSNGDFWGELFLTYQITANKELKFNLVESFLYPLN